MDLSRILTALAELTTGTVRRELDVSHRSAAFVWLFGPLTPARERALGRLAKLDVLHREERLVRRGWAFVCGSTEVDGTRRTVCLPLIYQPVRVHQHEDGNDTGDNGENGDAAPFVLRAAGDREITPLIEDRELAARLELAATDLGDPEWIRRAAAAAGFDLEDVVVPRTDGPWRAPKKSLFGVTGVAAYVEREPATHLPTTLLTWAARPGLEHTALAAIYGLDGPAPAEAPATEAVLSPLPLNEAQREIVRRARTEPVVTVSGPPGNGKSHAVVASAMDAVDRGLSVLLATQSIHAAEVLGELLERYAGPAPVLFGDTEKRMTIAMKLAQGTGVGVDSGTLAADESAVAAAARQVERLTGAAEIMLDRELRAARAPDPALVAAMLTDTPGALDADLDLRRAWELLARAASTGGGWWRSWRRRRADRGLRRLLRAEPGAPLDRLAGALEMAADLRAATELSASTGTDLGPLWTELTAAEATLADALGTGMRHRTRSAARLRHGERRAIAALASALQAGRARRREALAALDGRALVRALPLWIGTVTDVEDLLPPVPGLFDLVIVDEASHVDQIRAGPVLARARRALVVGDPRQLRFVSFLADAEVSQVLDRHGLAPYADRLDVRRLSLYDLAAGAAAVTWLDEHYRSAPHLIEFSANRFYDNRIALASRHPRNDRADVIEVVRVDGRTDRNGVNAAELDAVATLIRRLADSPGIGVITPFRAQAEAIEEMLLRAFTVEEIEKLRLRAGTVHSFQGSEADQVIVSLGLSDEDPMGRRRFAANQNLFNVMITRARQRLIVVTSLTEADGLIGDYLRYSEQVPDPVEPARASGWTGALAVELERNGLPVRVGYPVGRWTVDLCVGEGADAVGLICAAHPDGVAAHLERQRALAGLGWRLRDAFASRWNGDAVRAGLEIAVDLRAA